jgi:aspartate aminotransferase
MTGVRLGWTVAAQPLVSTIDKLQSQISSNPSVLSQAAAEGALLGDQRDVEDLRERLQANRDAMLEGLRGIPDLRVTQPQGGLYCFPDFSSYGASAQALADRILEQALVVTVPGPEFGMEGYLRLSFAGERTEIVEGVRRIRRALDPSAPDKIEVQDPLVGRDSA